MYLDNTFNALKYPDYHTWRDLEAARKNGSRWPNGEPVRLSDPEMKPWMDAEIRRFKEEPGYVLKLLQITGLVDDNRNPTYDIK
jgi:hypothetical protein